MKQINPENKASRINKMKTFKWSKYWGAPNIILTCFILALIGVLLYEIKLKSYEFECIGFSVSIDIISKICYSIIGISVFYYFSQYIPLYAWVNNPNLG